MAVVLKSSPEIKSGLEFEKYMKVDYVDIKPSDLKGSYNLKVTAGYPDELNNLCRFCGKCAECEHPYWDCPEINRVKDLYTTKEGIYEKDKETII